MLMTMVVNTVISGVECHKQSRRRRRSQRCKPRGKGDIESFPGGVGRLARSRRTIHVRQRIGCSDVHRSGEYNCLLLSLSLSRSSELARTHDG